MEDDLIYNFVRSAEGFVYFFVRKLEGGSNKYLCKQLNEVDVIDPNPFLGDMKKLGETSKYYNFYWR